MKIGKKKIDHNSPVFIIAEAGINHNGYISLAKKMIKSAASCGVDAIKFQTIFPEELYSEKQYPQLFRLIKKWSFNQQQHNELKKFCEKYNLEFFSTPVGKKSANLLSSLGVKFYKIASGELTNHDLILQLSKTHKPLIISTGMSTLEEIASAIKIPIEQNTSFALLHCISSYPTKPSESNLINIKYLREIFSVPVGYSDHTLGIETCLAAVSLGACIIEKHFTLDKNLEGPDQKLSANPKEFKDLVNKIRIIEKSLGSIRTGPFKSEMKFRKLMRKSIAASKDIKKGTKIDNSMLTFIRPGTGIPPYQNSNLIGLQIRKNVSKGTILDWKMF